MIEDGLHAPHVSAVHRSNDAPRRICVVDKGSDARFGDRRGQVILGTRFGAVRPGDRPVAPPMVDHESGWYHAAAIREAENVADVLPFPCKPH